MNTILASFLTVLLLTLDDEGLGQYSPEAVGSLAAKGELIQPPSYFPYIVFAVAILAIAALRSRVYGSYTFEEARQVTTRREIAAEVGRICKGQPWRTWGGIPIRDRLLAPHFAILGQSGSGKTTLIRMLLGSVLRETSNESPPRCLIYDPKREMARILAGIGVEPSRIHHLNPFDERSSAWEISRDITTDAEAAQLGAMLVPDEQHSASPYFSQAAQELVVEVIKSFASLSKADGHVRWTLNDVLEACSTQSRIEAVLGLTADGTESIARHLSKNERTIVSVMATLGTRLRRFEPIARIWERCDSHHRVSLRDWIRSSDVLVLGNDDAHDEVLKPINQLIFRRASQMLDRLPELKEGDSSTWVVLDELRSIGHLEGLEQLLIKGRSKGIRIVLGFQDIDGIASVYGEAQCREMLGQCGNVAVLRLENAHAQEWASKYFGEYYAHISSSSLTFGSKSPQIGMSDSTSLAPLVLPSFFRNLPPASRNAGLFGVFTIPIRRPWRAHVTTQDYDMFLPPMAEESETSGFAERAAGHQQRVPWPPRGLPPHLSGGVSGPIDPLD